MLCKIWFGQMWITKEPIEANGEEAVVDQVIKGFPGKAVQALDFVLRAVGRTTKGL